MAALGMDQPPIDGGDTLVITKVMRDVWVTRISKYDEKEKVVGGAQV